jgi:hypothetical protein
MLFYYNSLDLDYEVSLNDIELSCTKELADKITLKIAKCKYSVKIQEPQLSNKKGYHIEFYCTKSKCDLCRMQFDDIRRFEMDKNRPIECTNLIWDSKHGY